MTDLTKDVAPTAQDRARVTFHYFNQGVTWVSERGPMNVADMTQPHAKAALGWLERGAANSEFFYSMGEASAVGRSGLSEDNIDAISRELEHEWTERAANPVEWIRSTTLYVAVQSRAEIPCQNPEPARNSEHTEDPKC